MRVMISGGGTGGGVYPALSIADALRASQPGVDFLWVGSSTGPEGDLVTRHGIAFEAVRSGPLAGVGFRAVLSLPRIIWGAIQALGLVRRFKPNLLLMTGGWVTLPATLACWLRGVPIVIYMPDIEPGGTIRILSRFARAVAVSATDSIRYFPPGQAVETGYPLRSALLAAAGYDPLGEPTGEASQARERGMAYFGLDERLLTLLVLGGSSGARSINRALVAQLERILKGDAGGPGCQIIHISGRLDWAWIQDEVDRLPPEMAAAYHPVEYLHTREMAYALAVADVVVGRAGASTLGEFPLFDLPAILVPYPYAWRYQKTNADYLVSRQAALQLDDERLMEELASVVSSLLIDDRARERMAKASSALKRPDAAARVAAILIGVAQPALAENQGKRT
jgi:UDP-N-acetylglucosamine--N-acetylmuramyl-(pentapeptide) pyrophosphoryl-undecaprenol N-acetylglucosamine transferase